MKLNINLLREISNGNFKFVSNYGGSVMHHRGTNYISNSGVEFNDRTLEYITRSWEISIIDQLIKYINGRDESLPLNTVIQYFEEEVLEPIANVYNESIGPFKLKVYGTFRKKSTIDVAQGHI